MNATLRNEMRPVTRQRFDVIWCPFCDRSRQETRPTPFCEGCGAEFTGGSPIAPVDALSMNPESTPDALDTFVDEMNAEHPELLEPPRRSRSRRAT
jgi:ribosomal protein L37AE/L43A